MLVCWLRRGRPPGAGRDNAGESIIDPENNKNTSQQGPARTVWCATSPQLNGDGGVYCEDRDLARTLPAVDSKELPGLRPRATDPVAAARLWQFSWRTLHGHHD